MKNTLIILLTLNSSLFIGGAAALVPGGGGDPLQAGFVKVVTGETWLYPEDRSPRKLLLPKDVVGRGDYLMTNDFAVEIELLKGGVLRVLPHSFVRFNETIALMRGAVLAKKIQLETPHASVSVEEFGWAFIRTDEDAIRTQVLALKPGVIVSHKFDHLSSVRLDVGLFTEVGLAQRSLLPATPKGVDLEPLKQAFESYGILEKDRESLESSIQLWARNDLPAALEPKLDTKTGHALPSRAIASVSHEPVTEASKPLIAPSPLQASAVKPSKTAPHAVKSGKGRSLASPDDGFSAAESSRLKDRNHTLQQLRLLLTQNDEE